MKLSKQVKKNNICKQFLLQIQDMRLSGHNDLKRINNLFIQTSEPYLLPGIYLNKLKKLYLL